MSGAGLVSIRLPRSVMEAFEANALHAGIDKHEAARRLISSLDTLTDDQLIGLPEPPRESDSPRLSLYLGWPHTQTLATVSQRTQLPISCIVRRLIYGLAVTGAIQSVTTGQVHKLNRAPVQHGNGETDYGLYAGVILLALLAVAIVGIVLRYRWIRTRRAKLTTVSRETTPILSEAAKGADPQ